MSEKKDSSGTEFKVPEFSRNSANSMEVILYSYYLKVLGVPQNLTYGDWYYVPTDENEQGFLCKVYHKESTNDDKFNFSDFELLSSKYIRMVSIDEALALLNFYGYYYSEENAILISPMDRKAIIALDNNLAQTGITAAGSCIHGAHLKALFMVMSNYKSLTEIDNCMLKSGIFNFMQAPEAPDKESEDEG